MPRLYMVRLLIFPSLGAEAYKSQDFRGYSILSIIHPLVQPQTELQSEKKKVQSFLL